MLQRKIAKRSHRISLNLSAANLQIVGEFEGGPSSAVNQAIENWVACECKARLRAGLTGICPYCLLCDEREIEDQKKRSRHNG